MSDSLFNTQEEEVRRLTSEFAEVKDILRVVSTRLSQIERRMRLAFPTAQPAKHKGAKGIRTQTSVPSITPEAVFAIFDELVDLAREGPNSVVHGRLSGYGGPDLALICKELGVSLARSKSSKRVLVQAVLNRVRQSLLISQPHEERPRE